MWLTIILALGLIVLGWYCWSSMKDKKCSCGTNPTPAPPDSAVEVVEPSSVSFARSPILASNVAV